MAIKFKNLSGSVQSLLGQDIGQTFYVVDSDYRTDVQGWSQADGTGPLDLYQQRNPGRVFRTGDYSSDSLCIQAAIDAMVDFRGDTLFFTPGAYSLATALSIDVPDARWTGPRVSDPRLCRAKITDAVGSGCTTTAAADRMEVGFLEFVPKTATTLWSCAAAMDRGHFHDFFYNSDGIAASTSTIFLTHAGATMDYWKFSDFLMLTDAAQGPLVKATGAFRSLRFENVMHSHEAGTLASALFTTTGTGTGPLSIDGLRGNISGGGAVTALVTVTEGGIDTVWVSLRNVRGSIGYCASNNLVALGSAEAAEVGLADCYLDVVSGGAGGAGTAYTA